MSEKKRRWFQIHLSTAVVLMIVASLLLWMNLAPWTWESQFGPPGIGGKYRQITKIECKGFPFPYKLSENHECPVAKQIALDISLAILVLFMVCSLMEWATRRKPTREARKP